MAEPISTPRITSQYLDSFTSKTVRIVGKVTQLRGEQAIIDSEGVVTVHLNRVCPPIILSGRRRLCCEGREMGKESALPNANKGGSEGGMDEGDAEADDRNG